MIQSTSVDTCSDCEPASARPSRAQIGPEFESLEGPNRRTSTLPVEPLKFDPAARLAAVPFNEPTKYAHQAMRQFLLSTACSGASDITIQTDSQPRIELEGRIYRLGNRPWSASEVASCLCELHHAPNAAAEILGRRILDFSYEIAVGDGSRQRFRVNATGIHARDGFGIEISIRVLPTRTPDIEFTGLSNLEVSAMSPPSGLVVVAGSTGSGKSSTLAALTRRHLERKDHAVKIVDIQSPIEYTFHDVLHDGFDLPSTIGQSEIGRHIPDFASGVWSALRRKPHIIIVGEARDYETITASLEAALTGHLVYTTTHAGSVHDCIRRLLSAIPAQEREQRAYDLGISLRLIMVQHLAQNADGNKRVPLREWVSLSGSIREALLAKPPHSWTEFVHGIMTRRTILPDCRLRTLKDSARDLIGQGLLNSEEASRRTGLSFRQD